MSTQDIWYPFQNYNDLCMDLGFDDVGTPVVIADCRPGCTSQMCYFI